MHLSVDTSVIVSESALRDLLCQKPHLIPMAAVRVGASPLTLAWPEFKLKVFSRIDVIAFNQDGNVMLVECKLAKGRASTRTALGQILEHAN